MTTPNLELPEVPEAIQGASDEINAGFRRLDAITQLTVLDKDLTVATLPASPQQGDRYIIGSGARAGHVAYRAPTGWQYFIPRPGWRARVLDEDAWYVFTGSVWEEDAGGGGPGGGGGNFLLGATWVRADEAIEVPVNSPTVRVPRAANIVRASILTEGGDGGCVVDVRRDSYANYPPLSDDSICGATKPTIIATTKYEDTTLTGWTAAVAAGDVLRFVIENSSVFTAVYFLLEFEPT